MLREGRLAGADAVRRFLLEAEAAGRLDHPNIVPVHEGGELNGRHFFTMRLVEGGSLDDWMLDTTNWSLSLRPREGLPPVEPPRYSVPRMAQWVVKIARAVHYAHERGILHRDLKPANILLDVKGEPLVSDFGLAKLTQTDSSSGLTLSGTVLGTPAYMAPEQATGTSAQHTTAADIYSLGAILHQLLVGQLPLQGATALETLRRLVEEEPAPPSARNPHADRDLDTICLKCLAKNPAERYATAAALADESGALAAARSNRGAAGSVVGTGREMDAAPTGVDGVAAGVRGGDGGLHSAAPRQRGAAQARAGSGGAVRASCPRRRPRRRGGATRGDQRTVRPAASLCRGRSPRAARVG